MGIQGLRKFIEGSFCTKSVCRNETGDKAKTPRVNHVLIDANSIVHSMYKKEHTTSKQTIDAVLARITELLTLVVAPTSTLTVCFDGPAPVAKLQTQRLRRRKVSNMDVSNNHQFSHLSITTGALFMVELENRVAKFFQQTPCEALLSPVQVFVFGSTVCGEGESKIAQALAYLSLKSARAEDHSVAVLSNDIDLALTCFSATQFHNLFVLGPSSSQLIAVGDIIYRWLKTGNAFLTDASQLPSSRIDFTYLFLLNGGDHYVGMGEQAAELWKRYRILKAADPSRAIVSNNLLSVDVFFLAEVVCVSSYEGSADVDVGFRLLKSALWSLYTTATGICPNYRYVPEADQPTLCNVRAALKAAHPKAVRIQLDDVPPLTPLATFVALMPTVETLPTAVQRVVLEDDRLQRRLMQSNDPLVVADSATEAVEKAKGGLSRAEQYLCSFGEPVHCNYVPPRKMPTRHEQHLLASKRGAGVAPEAAPPTVMEVVPIHMPTNFNYQCTTYAVKKMRFANPFTTEAEKWIEVGSADESNRSRKRPR